MKNRLIIALACLLLVILAPAIGTPVAAAQGKTLVVTSIAEAGPGTLRQALLDAQSGDTITFDTAVFPPDKPATIFFKTSLEIEGGRNALPYLKQDNITIDASNAGVILDGSRITDDQVRCLEIHSDGNVIQGLQIINFSRFGIYVGGNYNVIGGDRGIGAGPIGQGNLVGKNRIGINLFAKASYNTIAGNLVGTDVTGTDELGNNVQDIWTEAGAISIVAEASNNTIGPDNIIAFNGGHGIAITSAQAKYNTITQNSIYDNEGEGVAWWDKGDVDLFAPTIIDFDLTTGTVTGSASANCIIEIFSDSGNEGRVYEGRITADSSGFFAFSKGSPLTGPNLTATATDSDGNTSGFSRYASYTYVDRIVTDDEVWQDETITAYKMVTVKNGASLTLRNVTLTFESPIDEECGIVVEPGSSLVIYNSTLSRPLYQDLEGFHIEVEDASFIMRDSILDGAGHDCPPVYNRDWVGVGVTAALTLDRVKDAVIEGNEITHIQTQVMVWHDVSDSLVRNNTIIPLHQMEGHDIGFLDMWGSRDNVIADNYITGVSGAISMNNHSTGNYVARNKITTRNAGALTFGIQLTGDSNNNILSSNEILDSPGGGNAFVIYTRNNVISNNTIRDFKWGILLAAGADGNIVANNNLSKIYHEEAIMVYRSNGNYIINNNISSSIRGISVSRFSQNNTIRANTISNSRQGILIAVSSSNNLIVNNKVSKNKVGIMVYKSSGNKIYDNSFIGNSQQAYDDGENIWSLEDRGNYWSDYKGGVDTAYDIAPTGIDEHPLPESVPIIPVQIPEPGPLTFREICTPAGLAIEGEVRYEDAEVLMENSYWIPEGNTLILENVTLRSYKEAGSPYKIQVDGGTLIISNSKIIAPETGIAPITIWAKKGSILVIKDSELYHVDSGMRDPGPSGGGIVIDCEGAVIEGNLITDSRVGVRLQSGAKSAHIVNNTFEGCMMPTWSSSPFGGDHLIEGNTIRDPVPAEKLNSELRLMATMLYHLILYWLRDPRVIAGLSIISIGVVALVWLLVRRHLRRRAEATGTG